MENALIVSCLEESTAFLTDLLISASLANRIDVSGSCGEARRLLLERDFELVVIDAPLLDESGESFSRHIAAEWDSQVILIVESGYYDAVSDICEGDGVLTVSKPVNRAVFRSALRLAAAAQNRLRRVHDENITLKRKIEDIRVIDRAKCLLISCFAMSECEAHRYIEKQAMDTRLSKRAVAEGIVKKYAYQSMRP